MTPKSHPGLYDSINMFFKPEPGKGFQEEFTLPGEL